MTEALPSLLRVQEAFGQFSQAHSVFLWAVLSRARSWILSSLLQLFVIRICYNSVIPHLATCRPQDFKNSWCLYKSCPARRLLKVSVLSFFKKNTAVILNCTWSCYSILLLTVCTLAGNGHSESLIVA